MLVEINKKQYDSLVKIAAAFEVEVEWLVEKGLKESIKTNLEVVEVVGIIKPLNSKEMEKEIIKRALNKIIGFNGIDE